MMNDEELTEFFISDMQKKRIDGKVHPIPKGDPVFMFCVFQGKQSPIQTFIDSGANCWLAQEGIPER